MLSNFMLRLAVGSSVTQDLLLLTCLNIGDCVQLT